jgi:hypothetical protein
MSQKMISIKSIAEDFSLKAEDFKDLTEINFDFSDLKKINSLGLRSFIVFLKSIPASTKITYHHCSPHFVHMLNIVDGLLPTNVEIKSLVIPYFCPTCQNDYNFEISAPFQKSILNEERHCPEDQAKLEFFYSENTFFKFLKD